MKFEAQVTQVFEPEKNKNGRPIYPFYWRESTTFGRSYSYEPIQIDDWVVLEGHRYGTKPIYFTVVPHIYNETKN